MKIAITQSHSCFIRGSVFIVGHSRNWSYTNHLEVKSNVLNEVIIAVNILVWHSARGEI